VLLGWGLVVLMIARVVGMGVCTDGPGRVGWWLMGVCGCVAGVYLGVRVIGVVSCEVCGVLVFWFCVAGVVGGVVSKVSQA
jgi:hypothetical protein